MNNYAKRKYTVILLVLIIVFLVAMYIVKDYETRLSVSSVNNKFSTLISLIRDKYPNVDENKIISELNRSDVKIDLSKYGINIEKEYIDNNLINYNRLFLLIYASLIALFIVLILLVAFYINRDYKSHIEEIIQMIDEINNKNYDLHMSNISEDTLSKLKSEILKTSVLLKEQAENSRKDKINIKDSLSDISHQIKTPLTSIMIMLDNMLDDPNMEIRKREEFLKKIKLEIKSINFLTNSILKLSRFDSSTVNYNMKEFRLYDILSKAISNVELLCDLKNIRINVDADRDITLVCDIMWQVEAISNLIKNAVENSSEGSSIDISASENRVYVEVKIRDHGVGIDKKDLPHIFERFYRGSNSSHDSIGIGLALSKAIVEKNNGSIGVNSKESGVEFVIKYFK